MNKEYKLKLEGNGVNEDADYIFYRHLKKSLLLSLLELEMITKQQYEDITGNAYDSIGDW